MLNQKRLAEALIGPPSDPYRLAERVGNPRKVLFRAGDIDGGQLIARNGQPQRAGAIKRLLGIAEAALDAKGRNLDTARIWWE